MSRCGDHGGRTKNGSPCRRPARDGEMCSNHAGLSKPGPAPTEDSFTEEQIAQIERLASRCQEEDLCYVVELEPRTFQRMKARDPRISSAYKKGRVKMGLQLVTTLLNMALGRREVVEISFEVDAEGDRREIGREVVLLAAAPHPASLFFILKTQFGFRETDRHEHTGAEGGPIEVAGIDVSQLNAKDLNTLDRLLARASISPN